MILFIAFFTKESFIMQKDYYKELNKAIGQNTEIYKKIIEQRDMSKSKTLKSLLDNEINAYVNLCLVFKEYLICLGEKLNNNSDRRRNIINESIEIIKSFSDPLLAKKQLERTKQLHEQLLIFDRFDELICELSINNFLFSLSRDCKNWDKFSAEVFKTILTSAVDIAVNLNPIISTLHFLMDKTNDIIALKKQHLEENYDYKDIDMELFTIETHTEIMETAAVLFQECSKILKESDNSTDTFCEKDYFDETK